MNDLYVFPIGISRDANMSYVCALNPEHHGYQMINENDFETIFSEIENIVNATPSNLIDDGVKLTKKASFEERTKDTGLGTSFDLSDFDPIINKNISEIY